MQGSARERLLTAVIDYVAAHGVGDRSLRQLAAEIGTSHRMLLYHFGSKDKLLLEVVREVERRQHEVIGDLAAAHADDHGELIRSVWRQLSDPALRPNMRLFFEVYGRELGRLPQRSTFLDEVIGSWLEPLAELLTRSGTAPEEAAPLARLGLAAFRGLFLDLVTTGERKQLDVAVERLAEMYETYQRHRPARDAPDAGPRRSSPPVDPPSGGDSRA